MRLRTDLWSPPEVGIGGLADAACMLVDRRLSASASSCCRSLSSRLLFLAMVRRAEVKVTRKMAARICSDTGGSSHRTGRRMCLGGSSSSW